MNPEIEKFRQQRSNLLNEVSELATRADSLKADINRVEGVLIYLDQKGQAEAEDEDGPIEELTPI